MSREFGRCAETRPLKLPPSPPRPQRAPSGLCSTTAAARHEAVRRPVRDQAHAVRHLRAGADGCGVRCARDRARVERRRPRHDGRAHGAGAAGRRAPARAGDARELAAARAQRLGARPQPAGGGERLPRAGEAADEHQDAARHLLLPPLRARQQGRQEPCRRRGQPDQSHLRRGRRGHGPPLYHGADDAAERAHADVAHAEP